MCHRELHLESALLHRRDARSALQVKVCEFGLSRVRLRLPDAARAMPSPVPTVNSLILQRIAK